MTHDEIRFGRQYLAHVSHLIDRVATEEWEAIAAAARLIADALLAGRDIHALGSGHSHMLAEEMFYRAGGLVDVRPILFEGLMLHADAPMSTCLERLPGLAEILLERHGLRSGDVLLVFSNSGRNPITVEAAETAKRHGVSVIAITSRRHSESTAARGGTHRLFEVADVVIDNGGEPGDAAIHIPGFDQAVAPTSTAVGAAIVNAIVAEAVALVVDAGVTPRVFVSNNIDVGDARNALLESRT
ncbi:MAG: SIS domain-containing protein [Candidatus Lumbricidophila eiseniae]|uniref:SIS domain-containing protein n=1 Tax=Candidatus Lumbricidiphila eiseniae TaxID=1969409 RepID=A0A2A6FSQ8_9MICO|nr:MAG: SIS domain-containing protein [Candidatus Lumbricidophila eiseniae]